MGRTANQGMFVKFSDEILRRIHSQRRRRGQTGAEYVRAAVTDQLARDEEEERRVRAEREDRAERDKARRNLKPPSTFAPLPGLAPTAPTPPKPPDATKAASYVLGAQNAKERDERLRALSEAAAIAAPDAPGADAWMKAIRDRVESLSTDSTAKQPAPPKNLFSSFFNEAVGNRR